MTLENLPDNPTQQDIMNLDKESLDLLPYEVYQWICCFKDCNCGTTIRDYGIHPYYLLNRNSKGIALNPKSYWVDLFNQKWFCGKHWKYYKRLGSEYVFKKFVVHKPMLGKLVKKINQENEQLG